MIAWVTFAVADGSAQRRLLLAVLTTIWGLRLTLHLARRNLGHGEDFRCRTMRERHGKRWPRLALWAVFWRQGLLMWIVSLPVQAGQADPTPRGLIWLGDARAAAARPGLELQGLDDFRREAATVTLPAIVSPADYPIMDGLRVTASATAARTARRRRRRGGSSLGR